LDTLNTSSPDCSYQCCHAKLFHLASVLHCAQFSSRCWCAQAMALCSRWWSHIIPQPQ